MIPKLLLLLLTLSGVAFHAHATGQAVVSLIGIGPSKVYDGTTTATLTPDNYRISGIVGREVLNISGVATYADKNASTFAKTVSVTDITLVDGGVGATRGLASNYTLSNTEVNKTAFGTITKKPATVSGFKVSGEIRSGRVIAHVTAAVSGLVFNGILPGDDVTVASAIGVFTNTSLEGEKRVIIIPVFSGADASNYEITVVGGPYMASIESAHRH